MAIKKFFTDLLKKGTKEAPKRRGRPPKSATPPKRGPGRPPKSATAKPKATPPKSATQKRNQQFGKMDKAKTKESISKNVPKDYGKKATGVTKKAPAKKPSAKAKPVPAKTPTTKQKIGAAAITAGVIGGGLAGKKPDMDKMSFNEAFKAARKELGTDKTFTWRGKKYSTVTMDEVKKAGFDTLAEYNRSKTKKPETKNMKKGGYAKMKDGGSVKKMKKGGYAKMKDGGMACGGRAARQQRQQSV